LLTYSAPEPAGAAPHHAELNSPPEPCLACPRHAQLLDARQQAGYWKAMHQGALARLTAAQQEIEQLRAQLRLREHQLFGRRSEQSTSRPDHNPADPGDDRAATTDAPAPKRRRGRQRGQASPRRRDYSHLPTTTEDCDLTDEQRRCPCCGLPYQPFPGTEDGELIEVEVQAHRRVYRRHRYRPTCACAGRPGILTAPGPAKLLPKTRLGISAWVHALLDKYAFGRPSHRLLQDWRTIGLDVAAGTLTDGFRRLVPLFEPLYDAIVAHQQGEHRWHADETRWLVFVAVEGKAGYRWYLWVFRSDDAVAFVLDPSRSHATPEGHLGDTAEGILNVDRYSAYKALALVKAGQVILAFCWAHVRRDFLGVARAWPAQQRWALGWVTAIAELYHCNERRLEVREDSEAFAQRDLDLRAAVAALEARRAAALAEPGLHPAREKVLVSLGEHWSGLTVFVEHSEVPMDNNAAERALRGAVVGRKNYAGSGALWSGRLLAVMLSLLGTLGRWRLNARAWLTRYCEACAAAGGQAPAEAERWLPWNLSEAERQALAEEPARQDSS